MNNTIEFEFILKIENKFYKKYFSLEELSEASYWIIEDWRIEILERHYWIKWEEIKNLKFEEYKRIYTELLDKNWDKIFNWDILELDEYGVDFANRSNSHTTIKDKYQIVNFHNGCFQINSKTNSNILLALVNEYSKIKWNIYENSNKKC